jgi:hypothetical protein
MKYQKSVGLAYSPEVDFLVITTSCENVSRLSSERHAIHRIAVCDKLF